MNSFLWFLTGVLSMSAMVLALMVAKGVMRSPITRSGRTRAAIGATGMFLVAAVQLAQHRVPFGLASGMVALIYIAWALGLSGTAD